MDAVQQQKILSIDITLRRLGAKGPTMAHNGCYWLFSRGPWRIGCGIYATKRRDEWMFGCTIHSSPDGPKATALYERLRQLAYYDTSLDEVARVANKGAAVLKQLLDSQIGWPKQ